MSKSKLAFAPPIAPSIGFNIGVTGHRDANPALSENRAQISAVLEELFGLIDAHLEATQSQLGVQSPTKVTLHTLLVEGVDQMAANLALVRSWGLVSPLPFGKALNAAINAHPTDGAEAHFLLSGTGICSPSTQARATAINNLIAQAHCFELAEADDAIASLFMAKLLDPTDIAKAQAFSFASSQRVALAAQVMIEQCDLVIGIWDGATTSFTGGTGHTIALALSMGTPVLWINARAPQNWQILQVPEALAGVGNSPVETEPDLSLLKHLISSALDMGPVAKHGVQSRHLEGLMALDPKSWRARSHPLWHGYRRIEALFGAHRLAQRWRNLTQIYETPDQIAAGSASAQLQACTQLPGQQPDFVVQISLGISRRFAWADGISSRLSDTYRGGMVMSFLFSAFAIVGGIAYLPFATSAEKWIFALFELGLLAAILAITFIGQQQRWHGRWFETRRVAEYLRSAPLLLVLGVARPTGRWPKGTHTSWPEHYVRHAMRAIGLPRIALSSRYLHQALSTILLPHVSEQRNYHRDKARRLAHAHHRLDQVSELLFKLAVASVCGYLALKLAGTTHIISKDLVSSLSKLFTFLGVLLPTFGGAISGIRYFGDFERFASISDVTAHKLEGLIARIDLLLSGPENAMTYDLVSSLAHAIDDVVIGEIESWQAVFSGKQISVPV
jgi:hypothetical protein